MAPSRRFRPRAMRRMLRWMVPLTLVSVLVLCLALRGPSGRCSPYQRIVATPAYWDEGDSAAVTTGSTADGPGSDVAKMVAIKSAFLTNYDNYTQHAWGCNILEPLTSSGSSNQGRIGAYGATIIDSLTTMVVMNLHLEEEHSHLFTRALNFTQYLDFTRGKGGDKCTSCVSVFEATIRYIGSLLSTWELLDRPPKHRWLVDQAETLAKSLLPGFVYSIPYNYVNINKRRPRNTFESGSLAAAGTLLLEWERLSLHTGNETYAEKVREAQRALIESGEVLPGLVGSNVYAKTGKTNGNEGRLATFGPGGDSYYEYIAKAPLLGDGLPDEQLYISTFIKAWESTRDHLVVKTGGSAKNLTFLADYHASSGIILRQSQLTCFAGSMFALMGRHLSTPSMTTLGLELTESCAQTFLSTSSGVGPQEWRYRDAAGQGGVKDGSFYSHNGFDIISPGYYHGPEAIESIFYAWRITGDPIWREMAWSIFQSLSAALETGNGWASLSNVNARPVQEGSAAPWNQVWENEQGSFLYAEVFKYLYLTFTSPSYYSLDDWVFNTEAHPFRRRGGAGGRGEEGGVIQADSKAGPFLYEPLVKGLKL